MVMIILDSIGKNEEFEKPCDPSCSFGSLRFKSHHHGAGPMVLKLTVLTIAHA